eukprot:133213-Rhodomonas_salina.1
MGARVWRRSKLGSNASALGGTMYSPQDTSRQRRPENGLGSTCKVGARTLFCQCCSQPIALMADGRELRAHGGCCERLMEATER